MYYVITCDNYCSVVPDIWVNLSEKTFAFPTTGTNATSAIKKKIRSEDDWNIYENRKILGPYDSYERARSIEKTCINISSSDEMQLKALSEQSTPILPVKRLVTKKRFYDKSDESETNNQLQSINYVPILMVCYIADMLWDKVDGLSKEFHEFRTDSKQQFQKNMSKMKELIAILKEKCPNTANDENPMDNLSLLPDFPLLSREEFFEFNNRLKNDEAICKCFQTIMQIGGGDTSQKIVSNILSYTITYDLGHKLSWTGAKGSIAVKDSPFINIVVGVISAKNKRNIDDTIVEIQKHIKNWLQHAGDKMRYHLKKVNQ
ncbi:uncharacterized protein LOC116843252 [Odontomachus brunneus]|uniref:uncharacterized protein LOC116843252 n=1 Tax=Odontomachus brunneus TaxID=486640 RepID=UPI0013F1928D|nr:uncharacterized protein LOC116843252 [Odontomachus brunneus]